MAQHEYTYTIKKIDVLNANIEVKYVPTNPDLVAVEWNICAYMQNEDGSNKSIQECIEAAAPHALWTAQETLIAQHDTLLNKTETVTPA